MEKFILSGRTNKGRWQQDADGQEKPLKDNSGDQRFSSINPETNGPKNKYSARD